MFRLTSIQLADIVRFLVIAGIVITPASAPVVAAGRVPFEFGRATLAQSSSIRATDTSWTRGAVLTHRAIVRPTPSAMLQSTAASVTAPWAEQDIGAPPLAGSSTQSGNVFSVSGSGADIWGTSDQFHFVYQPLTGDGDIIARVDSISGTNPWAKAGVMIRETLTAGSTHAFALVSAGRGAAFQRRTVTGGSSYHTTGALVAAPLWVRLVRIGNTFSAYQSTNGTVWQLIGSQSIPMATSVFAGLAVTSHDTTVLATASFSNVGLASGTFNQLPSVQLTSPAPGAAFTAPATISLTANASDADGSIASVSFLASGKTIGSTTTAPYTFTWANVPTGSYTLSAVATDNTGAAVVSSTVTVSVADPVGALPAPWTAQDIGSPALAGRSGTTSTGFTVEGAGTDIWYTSDQLQFMSQPLTGDGQVVARVDSIVYTAAWAKAGVMIRESTAAGSTHAFALVSAGKGVAFQRRVTTGGSSTNTAGSTSTAPRWVKIARQGNTFSAYESGDGVNWNLIGSDTITMATTVLAGLAVNSHNANALTTATFSNVAVTPAASSNQPPTVSITSPAAGFTFGAPAVLNVAASASDPDGTVAKVDFYAGSVLLGTATSSPFGLAWNLLNPGTYTITAVATDNSGASTTSAAVSITANPSTAVFTASADDATLVTSYRFNVYAAGADPTTATPIATQDLGKPTPVSGTITVDITKVLQPLAPGNYIATVSAVGSGGSSQSTPVSFVR